MSVYEPRHLLKFAGNPELELHYRSLIYNLHRVGVETDEHRCRVCNDVLSTKEGTRLKPPQRMTKTIQKLMSKKSRKIPLSRIEHFKLNKFMDSSQQMVVTCSECTFINKIPTIGRRDLIKLRSKHVSEVEDAVAKEKSEEAAEERMDVAGQEIFGEAANDIMEIEEYEKEIEEINKKEPVTKETKKKKKKKRKKTKDFISTLLQQKVSEKKKTKKEKESSSTPLSLRDFVLSESSETPSPSLLDVFHKAIHGSSSNISNNQTPGGTDSTAEISHQQSITKSSSKKPKRKSKNKKELQKSLFFETVECDNTKTKMSATNSVTPVSTKPSPATSSSKKSRKKTVQRELKKYLTEVPQLQEKSSSLKDFLISL